MREFQDADELRAAKGEHLGYSDWVEITQDRVNLFADATGDHQWIHVDPERAKDGPFGTTIAHGYLTLSITNDLFPQLVRVPSAVMGVNYGANKVRFPAPVPVGSRIRMGSEIIDTEDVPGGVQVVTRNTVEIERGDKPACVVEAISRFIFEA
ncbi:MAG TPA: MaoC family dehydratase [Acidimicrobiia bacterium]